MRIGFDARWYNHSGVGSYVLGLLKGFAECNEDFQLIVYEDPRNPIPGVENLPFKSIPLRSSKYSVQEQCELSYRTRHDKVDVFHSPFYVVPFAAACPVVNTIHDLIPFLFTIYSRPKQLMVKTGYRASIARAARTIAVSNTTASDLRRLMGVAPEKISVVNNAVLGEYFHPLGDADELSYLHHKYGIDRPFVVISNPSNWRTKNVVTAFEVLALAKGEVGKPFQILAYGSGPNVDAINVSQASNVIEADFVSSEDLGILFRHAELFLLTSLYEGFGLPLLEAMSCGCPVVTSNGGSLAEVAGDGAWLFDPRDVRGMTGAVTVLLRNPDERERWRTRAIARASNFSWRKAAEQTVAVYRRVALIKSTEERVRPRGLRKASQG